MVEIVLMTFGLVILVMALIFVVMICYFSALSLFTYNIVWLQRFFPDLHEKYSKYYTLGSDIDQWRESIIAMLIFLFILVIIFSLLGKYSSLSMLLLLGFTSAIFLNDGGGIKRFFIFLLVSLLVVLGIFLYINEKIERFRFIRSWILEAIGVCISSFEIGYTAVCLKYVTFESHHIEDLEKINYQVAVAVGGFCAIVSFVVMFAIHKHNVYLEKQLKMEIDRQAFEKAEKNRAEQIMKKSTRDKIEMLIKAIDSLKKALRKMAFSDLEIKDIGTIYDEYSEIKSMDDGKKKLTSLKRIFNELFDFYKNADEKNDIKWFEACEGCEGEELYDFLKREFNGDSLMMSSLEAEYEMSQNNS